MSAVESLGKYEIRRQLGRGAMGTVYEGFDPIIERTVAIKTVRLPEVADDETAEEIARFRREAQAAGRLTHPNIVGVFDYGETADLAYIVMEYVDGPPLKNLLDKHERFPLPRIVQIMQDLLTGLQFSHERGVVHRDIKPANLMLTKSGQAKIADFGIARIESSSMTQAGTVLGTPAYMSPEQFMGQVVDARSDIYSSGVLLYQLLTGERPFEGSMSAIMHKALNTEAPMPSQISVTVPRPFDSVVRKAMAKRPDDRFASATEFLAAIRAAAAAPAVEVDVAEDNSDATMVMASRSPGAGAQQPRPAEISASALAASIAPPAASPAAIAAGTGAQPAKSSRLPVFIGAGVAGLAVLGGVGYFLLAGGSGPVPNPPSPLSQATVTAPSGSPSQSGTTAAPAPSQPAPSGPSQLGTPASSGTSPSGTSLPPGTSQTGLTAPAGPSQTTASSPPGPLQPGTTLLAGSSQSGAAPPRAAQTAITPPPAQPQNSPTVPPGSTQLGLSSPPPAAIQPPTMPPVTDPAATIRTEVAAVVAQLPCSVLGGDVHEGAIQLTGIAGPAALENLRQKFTAMGLTNPEPSFRVTQVEARFCAWENFLRPIARTFGAGEDTLKLQLADDHAWLVNNEFIRPRVTMADFRGILRVDYLDREGNVQHLWPQVADPTQHLTGDRARRLEPGEVLNLGEPGPGNPGWQVAPPFGTDLIVAIASEDALFDHPRPGNVENAEVYLRELKRGVESARSRGARIAATVMPVETRAK
jgi:serine/threonine-protein kinase